MNQDELVAHVELAVKNGWNHESKITDDILKLPGFSSAKVRHFLNNVTQMPDCRYLEVGTWKGSTLIPALYNNKEYIKRAVAIDDFSEFENPQEDLFKNLQTYCLPYLEFSESDSPFTFLEGDCWEHASKMEEKFNVYFYDGGHEEQEQFDAFVKFNHLLDDVFVAIVDDYNWGPVNQGTTRAFKELNYRVLKEWPLPARYNGDTALWWHGLYVAVISKQ